MPPKRRRSDSEPETAAVAVEDQTPQKDFWDTFKNYYGSSRDSDITLYLGVDKVPFPGHRFILRARCSYARAKEIEENGKYELYLKNYSPGVMKLMLQYIYTGDYNIDLRTADARKEFRYRDDPLSIHALLYCAASVNSYGVTGLQDLCAAKFKYFISTNCNTNSIHRCISNIFYCPEDVHAEPFILPFCDVEQVALGPVVIDAVLQHVKELREDPEFIYLMRDSPYFTLALAKKMLSDY